MSRDTCHRSKCNRLLSRLWFVKAGDLGRDRGRSEKRAPPRPSRYTICRASVHSRVAPVSPFGYASSKGVALALSATGGGARREAFGTTMFLQPPRSGSSPGHKRSTNCAFTGKKPAKIQKFTPEAEEGSEDTPKAVVQTLTPFGTWLRTRFNVELPPYKQQAIEYIGAGSPYMGESYYESKDVVQREGAKFVWNPAKKKGCTDKSIPKGWWSAPDDASLLRLLALDRDERGRRRWSCLELGNIQLNVVHGWLRAYFDELDASMQVDEESQVTPAPRRGGGGTATRTSGEEAVHEWIRAAADGRHVTPWVAEPECPGCERVVWAQFLDCGCIDAVWRRCPVCTAIYRPGGAPPYDVCKC